MEQERRPYRGNPTTAKNRVKIRETDMKKNGRQGGKTRFNRKGPKKKKGGGGTFWSKWGGEGETLRSVSRANISGRRNKKKKNIVGKEGRERNEKKGEESCVHKKIEKKEKIHGERGVISGMPGSPTKGAT